MRRGYKLCRVIGPTSSRSTSDAQMGVGLCSILDADFREHPSLLKKSVEGLWMDLNRVQRPKKWCHRGQKEAQKRVPESFSTRSPLPGTSVNKPPVEAPDPSGWHHGCCRPLGKTRVGNEEENFYVRSEEHGIGPSSYGGPSQGGPGRTRRYAGP